MAERSVFRASGTRYFLEGLVLIGLAGVIVWEVATSDFRWLVFMPIVVMDALHTWRARVEVDHDASMVHVYKAVRTIEVPIAEIDHVISPP